MTRPVRDLHFFHPYFRDGGVERSIILLSREFALGGVKTALITMNHSDHFLGHRGGEGLPVYDLGAKRAIASLIPLARHLRQKRPEWIVSFQSYANVVAILANVLAGRPAKVMVSERTAISAERGVFGAMRPVAWLKNRILLQCMRVTYRFAEVISANSGDGARDLENVLGLQTGRVRVLYNPTFDRRILGNASVEVRHPFIDTAGPPVIVSVGRLAAQKDFGNLIKAFSIVHRRTPCRLLILGEGPDRSILESLIHELDLSEDVALPGFVENPHAYVGRSDLFVLSSLYEGLPNALIEAVVLGIPCISTDCLSGPREILLDGRGGTLVPLQDPHALASAISAYLDDPGYAKALTSVARSGLSRFESSGAAKAYLECMESL